LGRTIMIQSKFLMIASTERFILQGWKLSHASLGKIPKEVINNTRVVWSDTSSDNDHKGCNPLVKCQIEATVKEKLLKSTLNNMVDNENVEVPHPLLAIEGVEFGHKKDGNRPIMDEDNAKI
jgi:hypothetical protein